MAVKYVKVDGEYYLLSCVKCSRFKDCTEKKLAFENFSHLRRHSEHLHEAHLVRLGQGVIQLIDEIDFGHKTSFIMEI